jgi:hypothetical protein
MTKITPLQQLIFHLDQASAVAFQLKDGKDLPVDMMRLYQKLDGYVADLMEYEANLPTNNN